MKPRDTRAVLNSTLDPRSKLVAIAMIDQMRAADAIQIAANDLTYLGIPQSTIMRVWRDGIRDGWLVAAGRPGFARTYTFRLDRLPASL